MIAAPSAHAASQEGKPNDSTLCRCPGTSQTAEPATPGKECADSWIGRLWCDPVATFTMVLAAFTAILAFFTIRLVAVTDITAQRELRAYIGVAFEPAGPGNPELRSFRGARLETAVYVTNHGQTPARDVRFKGWCKIMPTPLPQNHEFPDGKLPEVQHGPKACDPGHDARLYYQIRSDDTVQDAELRVVDSRLYAYGTVTYTDVFGNPCWTNFAAFYEIESSSGSHWFSATQHNDADAMPGSWFRQIWTSRQRRRH